MTATMKLSELQAPVSSTYAHELLARLGKPRTEVLALGSKGYTSKQIARRLDISPHTVDQRFRLAIQILGAADRRDSTRIFANLVAAAGYDLSVYQSVDIANEGECQSVGSGTDRSHAAVADSEIVEAPEALARDQDDETDGARIWLPFPQPGRRINELSIGQRVFWMLVIMIVTVVAIKTIIEALSELGGLLR